MEWERMEVANVHISMCHNLPCSLSSSLFSLDLNQKKGGTDLMSPFRAAKTCPGRKGAKVASL